MRLQQHVPFLLLETVVSGEESCDDGGIEINSLQTAAVVAVDDVSPMEVHSCDVASQKYWLVGVAYSIIGSEVVCEDAWLGRSTLRTVSAYPL